MIFKKTLFVLALFSFAQPCVASPFVIPDSLKNQVDFWAKIYAEYDSHQVVFFHEQDPRAIYHVMDLPKVTGEISAPKFRKEVKKQIDEIKSILTRADGLERLQNPSTLEKKIAEAVKKFSLPSGDVLVKGLRSQSGLRSQFAFGLETSGKYVDDMKAILKAHELPTELMALVFVESLFHISVISHAGASGPWGILKETARSSGIHVNHFIDERIDPVVATMGAANFLKKAKDALGEWPLAITAYNYGLNGMLRAKTNLQTSQIEDIIAKHESPIFGYASKNYYAEFLAALRVYENHDKLFPKVAKLGAWKYELVQVKRPVEVADLVKAGAVNLAEFKELNPALTGRTLNGHEVIPPEYALRIAPGKARQFYDTVNKKIPSKNREAAATKISHKYRANGRENIAKIASKVGISPEFLAGKMKVGLDHKPTGAINIRSQAYRFSQLLDVGKKISAAITPEKVASSEVGIKAPAQ